MKVTLAVLACFFAVACNASVPMKPYKEILTARNKELLKLSPELRGREEYSGNGEIKCYGFMDVTLDKWTDGVGLAECRTRAAAPAQGYVADGEDGSHWVVIDDKGTADCAGQITYTTGDLGLGYCTYAKAMSFEISPKMAKETPNPRLFCGYFTCSGYLNLVCDGMLSGCHGA